MDGLPNLITIGGLSGSGKSTVAKLLSKLTGFEYVYAGAIFRSMAEELNMDVEEFGKYAKSHPEIDIDLDRRMLERAKMGNAVIEGRMISYLVKKRGIRAFSVLIEAPLEIRAKRLAKRENMSYEDALNEILNRDSCDKERYNNIYGVDPTLPDWYNIIIDSSELSPEEICRIVLDSYRQGGEKDGI